MVFGDWLASLRFRSLFRKPLRRRRRRGVSQNEALEQRILLAAPVAVADSYEKVYDDSIAFNNFTGSVVGENDYDVDNNLIYAELTSSPALGTLEFFTEGGNFKYIPPPNWAGTDTFSYIVYE